MSYAHEHVADGGEGRSTALDLSDMSLDARRQIDGIFRALPKDCAGVIMDFCGFEKGLQQIERERGWPRRSAKLVLRIGLEQLAEYFGLMPKAVGQGRGGLSTWRPHGTRPTELE